MEEKFNKDIEEIKKSQSIMNNAINEIKSTLEGTNSRITEAEDRIWNILFLFLSIETLQARRDWQDILKMIKEKNLQPRLL